MRDGLPDAETMLDLIAAERAADPLLPVTVIAPSHAAALQLRRRLAGRGAYAGVRFEPLARIAELLGGGELAAHGRTPLARPIGDYVAEQIVHETRGALRSVCEMAGYARVLRQVFGRLRSGGIRGPDDVGGTWEGHLPEVLRLYGLFRAATIGFYDTEDLLEAAADAIHGRRAGLLAELSRVYVFSSAVRSAGSAAMIDALRRTTVCTMVDDARVAAAQRFVLAPDPASEAREAVREVVQSLEGGCALHEIAVLYGADPVYPAMLREEFSRAGVPDVALPGKAVIETPAGRALLGILELPERDYSRTAAMNALSIAPLRANLPGAGGATVPARDTGWDRISREAGITRGLTRWRSGLAGFIAHHEADLTRLDAQEEDGRRRRIEWELEDARTLGAAIMELGARLDQLRAPRRADEFVRSLKALMRDYLDPKGEGFDAVNVEIDQLATIAAVGGTFTLGAFTRALRANLEAAHVRDRKLGEGVLLADHRAVDGMRFKHVVLCGAREGALPAGPGDETLIEPQVWTRLRATHRYVEDTALRAERASQAAVRANAAASETLTWCSPLYESGGAREYYPSPMMVEAARTLDPEIRSGSDLRRRGGAAWLRRGSSPLALRLLGTPIDTAELRLRESVSLRQRGRSVGPAHRRRRAMAMSSARSGGEFSAWDGNLGQLAEERPLHVRGTVSPTALEAYGQCGFKYFCRSVLGMRGVEEPEEREMMEAATRGSLVHETLEAFFRTQQGRGRPAVGEEWTGADQEELFEILDERLAEAEGRGLRGMDVFAGHERRTLQADLAEFLAKDSEFRIGAGAVPKEFEVTIPETEIAGVRLSGIADRIDRSEDGRQAWVIDYKTGSKDNFRGMDKDPLLGGTKLQLPTYLEAAKGASEATAFYWFISLRGGFEQIEYVRTPEGDRRFQRTVGAIVGGIGAGAFPAVPGEYDDFSNGFTNCRYCDFDRICARRRDDAFAEKVGDPAVKPWLDVGRVAKGEA